MVDSAFRIFPRLLKQRSICKVKLVSKREGEETGGYNFYILYQVLYKMAIMYYKVVFTINSIVKISNPVTFCKFLKLLNVLEGWEH